MPLFFLLAIIIIPYLEFLVFMEVGRQIGGLSALMLTILTAVVGIYIIRREGIQVLGSLRNTMERGENPVSEIIHGFFLVIAGIFFLLPGFITDSIAILFAIGPVRTILGKMIIDYKIQNNNRPKTTFSGDIIIEGDYEEAKDENKEKNNQLTDKHNDKS